jgi:hypothetical protein
MEANVLDKIVNFVLERNVKNNLQEMPNRGNSLVELDFKIANNPKCPGKVFVVYDKIKYYNGSMKERGYGLLAFDEKTGDIIPDFEKSGGCYFGFFDDAKIINNIV